MGKISQETVKLVKEMSVGIVLYNLILGIAVFLLMRHFGRPVLPVLGGVLFGTVSAVIMVVCMAITTENIAGGHRAGDINITFYPVLQKVIYIIALVVFWALFKMDLPAAVLATIGIKAGAYLQIWVHKVLGRFS